MTDNRVMVLKLGLMVLSMKAIMKMEKSTGSGHSDGQMVPYILGNFKIIIYMEKVFTHGLTIENTKENGNKTKCTGKALLYGQTAVNI